MANKPGIQLLLGALCIGVGLVLWWILVPRRYDVSTFITREGTQYWELATGSKIGYYVLPTPEHRRDTTLLYLHGGPGGAIQNEHIASLQFLSEEGYEVILYDQIGSGHSHRLEDISKYSVGRHVTDLHEIITQIPTNHIVLMGHSWGAVLASQFIQSEMHKEGSSSNALQRISGLILTSPGPILPLSPGESQETNVDSLQLLPPSFTNEQANKEVSNLRTLWVGKMARRTRLKVATDREMDAYFDYWNQLLSRSGFCSPVPVSSNNVGGGYYAHIMTVKSFDQLVDRRSVLKKFQGPLLLLRGQCDHLPWSYAAEYKEIWPQTELVLVPNAGHQLTREGQSTFEQSILRFLLHP